MKSTVWLKWQLAYLSLNTRLPTHVILLSMGVLPSQKMGHREDTL